MVGVSNYLNWTTFSRNTTNEHDSLRVILYINIRLLQFHFSLRNDILIIEIFCIFLFSTVAPFFFLVNIIYSDLLQTALKYLKNTKANISNILIIIGDFNIRDNIWDLNFLYHSIYSDFLTDITNSMNLCMLEPTNQAPTRYSDNQNNSNLVIDLMFLRQDLSELSNYMIHLEWKLLSDHTPLTINITIIEEHI